ncbi:hypothetical protein ACIOG4_27830 [Streptomyces microflavus]|uniref:hypothetical protein n=1 Tax=Streptomyces microflavus TaxID=1919 RepID=UPI00382CCE13
MSATIFYSGRFRLHAPVSAEADELTELRALEGERLFTLDVTADGKVRGLTAGAGHLPGHPQEWRHALGLLERIALGHQQFLTTDATWVSDPGAFSGTVVVDTCGRFHDVSHGDDPDSHRRAHCDCYPITTCERCGDRSFLARDEDHPDRPALCVACHETARTSQAAAGHCCRDACALPTSHNGLCRP